MSTISEHTGNGNPAETRRQREETKEQLDGLLQHFDVLPSRVDRFLFKYIYVYLISLFFLAELLIILSLLARNLQVGGVLLQGIGLGVPPLLVIILVIWRFNIWRGRTPKTLRDLLEDKRIALPDGDADTSYLGFLERYRSALVSPKRYVLSGFLMILLGITFAYDIVQTSLAKTPRRMMLEGGAHSNWAKKLVSSPRLIEGLSPFLGMGADCR